MGEQVNLGKRTKISKGNILGDYVQLKDDVILTEGVQICPYKEVSVNILERKIIT